MSRIVLLVVLALLVPGAEVAAQTTTVPAGQTYKIPQRLARQGTKVEYLVRNPANGQARGQDSVSFDFPILGPSNLNELLQGDEVRFIFDPADPKWYYIDDLRNKRVSIRISGDLYLFPRSQGDAECKDTSRIGYGRFAGLEFPDGEEIADGAGWAEKTFRENCAPYSVQVRCATCKQAELAKIIADYAERNLTKLPLVRAQLLRPTAYDKAPTLGQQPSAPLLTDFKYVQPGLLFRWNVPVRLAGREKKTICHVDGTPMSKRRSVRYPRFTSLVDRKIAYFPIELGPGEKVFANSQILMPGGTYSPVAMRGGSLQPTDACKNVREIGETFKTGGEIHEINFAMPWRDTFCEWRGRSRLVMKCGTSPQRGGHEGIDIRPAAGADKNLWVVSATPGIVERVSESEGGIFIRHQDTTYIYLHMRLDAHFLRYARPGLVVEAGTRLGYVSTRMGGDEYGTSRHLHFEMMRPMPFSDYLSVQRCNRGKSCRSRENFPPYASLVYAYARSKGIALQCKGVRNTDSGDEPCFLLPNPSAELADWKALDDLEQRDNEIIRRLGVSASRGP